MTSLEHYGLSQVPRSEPAKESDLPADAMVRAAWLYYIQGLTQERIAAALGLSRIKVIRMLSAARSEGVVRIRIDARSSRLVELEGRLSARFGLKHATVVPAPADPSGADRLVGYAAGVWLSDALRDGVSVAVGWGNTLQLALRGMQPRPVTGMSVVSLLGGMTHSRSVNPSAVARRIADLFSADCFQLTAPVFVSGQSVQEALWREPCLRDLRARAHAADIALVSAGDISVNSTLFREGLLPREEVGPLIQAGAVGDVLCHFIDETGAVVDHPLNRRVMAISPSSLAGIDQVAIAAGGASKAKVIAAAIRAAKAKILITDETAAEALLKLAAATAATQP